MGALPHQSRSAAATNSNTASINSSILAVTASRPAAVPRHLHFIAALSPYWRHRRNTWQHSQHK
eukprot:3192892-Rhodomonas_salina.1